MDRFFITTGSGGVGAGAGVAIGGAGGGVRIAPLSRGNFYPSSASIDLLNTLPRAEYASHDSVREDAPLPCLTGTRVAILAEIRSWVESANGKNPPVYWLNGLAGIGKSAIAKSVADQAEEGGLLGATFFFSRADRPLCDPQLVLPTVAFQLAQADAEFNVVITRAIRRDRALGDKKLLPQLNGLILEPLLKINPNRRPVLIILDALDECEDNAGEVLRLLFLLAARIPFLRILITSRPEPHISSVFDETLNHAKTVLHDVEVSDIQQDIFFYLRTKLAQIPRQLGLRMDASWTTREEINSLVEKSGKFFVYAATSIRFIGDDSVLDPRRQLNLILGPQTAQEMDAAPYKLVDALYMGVLHNSVSNSNRRDFLVRFQVVVGAIVFLHEPLPLHSLAGFVSYELDEIYTVLSPLRSIIIVPTNIWEAPRIYHPSFRDFITDPVRCSDPAFVTVPGPEKERWYAIRCFELLGVFLKRDIAGISNPSHLNGEVDRFDQKVNDALLPEVQYACRYWASHLSHVKFGDETVVQALHEFSTRSLLWWFEAMSLIGGVSTAIPAMEEAHHWAINSKCASTLVTILADARRFILAHGEVIKASALHVYESALPFTPHDTALYRTYSHEASDCVRVVQGLESEWPPGLSSLLGHSEPVKSISFSPDGSRLASGSADFSVRLWDGMSGAPIATLKGHSRSITSIAFSPDGLQLASGSGDHSVRLWDTVSSASLAILEGHSDWVMAVAYSPDGLRLASSSYDCSVRLWDPISGLSTTLKGHHGPVVSITFSPDGWQLASGSSDCCVQLWDAKSGASIAILRGHSGPVQATAFSLDGLQLASGSHDCSVQLWDAISGASIARLQGHSGPVTCITFSPDALQLASGSSDCSVQLWDVRGSRSIAKLEGHSRRIHAIAYSPDGSQLASGSSDHSVQLWNAKSGTSIITLKGHSLPVLSVAFSSNGFRLASSSYDCSVRLWDPLSHASVVELECHSQLVQLITFSPDGLRLASGSYDCSVQLWDALLGTSIATLIGHSEPVTCIAFSPDGMQLASGSYDCSVQLWNAMTGASIATLQGHVVSTTDISLPPDVLRLASGFDRLSIEFWNAVSVAPITGTAGHSLWLTSVVFSPDGLRLASGSYDCSVRLWDAISGVPIATLEGHYGPVKFIAFSPDGSRLASSSSDRSVRLWNGMHGAAIATLPHSSPITFIGFSSDGLQLASGSKYHPVQFWDAVSGTPTSVPEDVSQPIIKSVSGGIWSLNGQWIQVQHPLENRVKRVCCIPPLYSPSTPIAVPHLPTISQLAIGCRDGRILILDIPRDKYL